MFAFFAIALQTLTNEWLNQNARNFGHFYESKTEWTADDSKSFFSILASVSLDSVVSPFFQCNLFSQRTNLRFVCSQHSQSIFDIVKSFIKSDAVESFVNEVTRASFLGDNLMLFYRIVSNSWSCVERYVQISTYLIVSHDIANQNTLIADDNWADVTFPILNSFIKISLITFSNKFSRLTTMKGDTIHDYNVLSYWRVFAITQYFTVSTSHTSASTMSTKYSQLRMSKTIYEFQNTRALSGWWRRPIQKLKYGESVIILALVGFRISIWVWNKNGGQNVWVADLSEIHWNCN